MHDVPSNVQVDNGPKGEVGEHGVPIPKKCANGSYIIEHIDILGFVQDIMNCNLREYQKTLLVKMITNLEQGKSFIILPPGRGGIKPFVIYEK